MEPSHSTGVDDSAIQVESFCKLQEKGAIVSGLNENFMSGANKIHQRSVFLFEKISTSFAVLANSDTSVTKQSE